MRYFSKLPLHTYGTVPQFSTSGAVAGQCAHFTTTYRRKETEKWAVEWNQRAAERGSRGLAANDFFCACIFAFARCCLCIAASLLVLTSPMRISFSPPIIPQTIRRRLPPDFAKCGGTSAT